MSLHLDPEIATALAPMAGAMAEATPPAVGDVDGRRAIWEPILAAAGTAQPIPPDVRTRDHVTTAEDGAQVPMRWYARDGVTPGSAVLFFHGGGYLFGHIDHFDGPVSRYVSASGVPMLSVEYRRAPPSTRTRHRSRTPTPHCAGSTSTPPSSVSTPAGSVSWATAPAAAWPRRCRS